MRGKLTKQGEVPAPRGPSVRAVSPDRQMLYVGQRVGPANTSLRIDQRTGGLAVVRTAAQPHVPTFLAPDRTDRFIVVAYYQGGGAAVFRLAADGTVAAPSQDWLATATGAHAAGPRHYCFHPSLDLAYFSNEQGSRVTSYRINPSNGALTALQTFSTAGFDARNTCSQIHLSPSGRFLCVGNRGHNSIGGFRVAPDTGLLMPTGHAATEVVPSALCLDPDGGFLFAAGTAAGRLACDRIDGDSGALTPLADRGSRSAADCGDRGPSRQ